MNGNIWRGRTMQQGLFKTADAVTVLTSADFEQIFPMSLCHIVRLVRLSLDSCRSESWMENNPLSVVWTY